MRLFIADDDAQLATLFRRVAEGAGWQVTTCANGVELLDELSRGSEPALLVIDIRMPKMDGIEVIDGITDLKRHVRVRFMTGGAHSSALAARMIATARDIDVGNFLIKPIPVADFEALLREEAAILADMS